MTKRFTDSFSYQKEIKYTNKIRREMGMEEVSVKNRTCLKCGTSFLSHGKNNRMCIICKSVKNNEGY